MAPEVAEIFRHYRWPGNVRELRNAVERAMILEDGDLITTTYLPRGLAPEAAGNSGYGQSGDREGLFRLPAEGVALEAVEAALVRQAVERSGGNQTRAAELLGISRDQLRYRLKKLNGVATEVD